MARENPLAEYRSKHLDTHPDELSRTNNELWQELMFSNQLTVAKNLHNDRNKTSSVLRKRSAQKLKEEPKSQIVIPLVQSKIEAPVPKPVPVPAVRPVIEVKPIPGFVERKAGNFVPPLSNYPKVRVQIKKSDEGAGRAFKY